jgi:hypothetical protein
MPRSDDPERAGGTYVVYWIDGKGKQQSIIRRSKGQARATMRHYKDKGLVSWIKPL